jgi:circadian clock protein KaiC
MEDTGLIPTGIDGLDGILLGGIKQGNILLVEGAPGTGKTTLGLEFIYRGAVEYDEPGLVISFELSPQKLLRDAHGFGWEFERLENQGKLKIVYTSPLVLLQELHSHDGLLMSEVDRLGARRLLIDGLTPLRVFGELFNNRPFRDSLHLLVESMQRKGLTAVMTREAPADERARASEFAHEEFVCDTCIVLRAEPRGRGIQRSIEVSKSRGQDYVNGRHTLRIEAGRGVRVYQRAQARPRVEFDQPTSESRSSLGVAALDEMIGKGVFDGSITLVVGVSGTGKTVLGVQFLVEGARQGKKCLLISLDEHPAQIMRNAKGLGLDLQQYVDEGQVIVHYDSPQELELDVHFDRIARLVDEHKIDRVLVDSLAAYYVNESDDREFRDYIYALATFFKDRLITAFMNFESPELLGVSQISQELKASTIVDNIILLNYVEFSNRLRRAITVPKARGSAPHRSTREYTIREGGIVLLPESAEAGGRDGHSVPQLPFSSYLGVLARSPARNSPIISSAMENMPVDDLELESEEHRQNARDVRAGMPEDNGHERSESTTTD